MRPLPHPPRQPPRKEAGPPRAPCPPELPTVRPRARPIHVARPGRPLGSGQRNPRGGVVRSPSCRDPPARTRTHHASQRSPLAATDHRLSTGHQRLNQTSSLTAQNPTRRTSQSTRAPIPPPTRHLAARSERFETRPGTRLLARPGQSAPTHSGASTHTSGRTTDSSPGSRCNPRIRPRSPRSPPRPPPGPSSAAGSRMRGGPSGCS